MGLLGDTIPIDLNITGFIGNTWIWVFVVALVGIAIVVGVALLLFFKTYKRKIIVWDPNTWTVVFRSRARVIRLGPERTELMKTFAGDYYVSAYDKKTNQAYWYVIGSDGYWYNVTMGDWDAKMGMIDIEPVERDVRLQHKANADLIRMRYGEKKNWEKWLFGFFLLALLIIFFVGMYVTWGRIADAVAPLSESNKIAQQNQETNVEITNKLANIADSLAGVTPAAPSGMYPS